MIVHKAVHRQGEITEPDKIPAAHDTVSPDFYTPRVRHQAELRAKFNIVRTGRSPSLASSGSICPPFAKNAIFIFGTQHLDAQTLL